jgi:hypothetical protein
MRVAWTAAVLACVACASVLGVDHDYAVGGDAGASSGGGPANDPGVRCLDGGAFCGRPAQECCLAPEASLACVDTVTGLDPCPGGTDIACDDPADCSVGEVCCISLNSQMYILGTRCVPSCAANESTVCDPAGPTASSQCTQGTCKSIAVTNFPFGWFHACQ